jgi:hypothetical protein
MVFASEPLTRYHWIPKAAALNNSSRVPRYQIREKSTVSAIFRVKPFAKDWKRVWEKVEAPHYGKEGSGWLRRTFGA